MTLYDAITAAVAHFERNGYTSPEELEYWLKSIRESAVGSMMPEHKLMELVNDKLTKTMASVIRKSERQVSRFTLEKVKPKLRDELSRRIMSNANLIRLNREQAIQRTLQRFSGWATSIPDGGSKAVDTVATKTNIRKALAQLPFEERRVIIDQGHKFASTLNEIIAVDGGAIAAVWHSHYRQPGYNYRKDHKERDQRVYAIRGNWALDQGLMKPGPNGYTDDITKPGEEVFCRCFATYIYYLHKLPDDMLTAKGKEKINVLSK